MIKGEASKNYEELLLKYKALNDRYKSEKAEWKKASKQITKLITFLHKLPPEELDRLGQIE